jgi:outer membrane receptor protein involved in Fe transport
MRNPLRARALALLTAWVLFILPLAAVPAMAQATTGTLRGTVTDPNGGVIAGATVTAKNEGTGTTTPAVTTTGEGIFEFTNLQPGNYTVTIEAPGFKRSVSTGVNVKAGIVNPLPVALAAGNVSETVTVVANTEEVVQREQSQISTTVDTRKVEDLPSNAAASGLDTLALLAPGVFPTNSGGVNTNGTGLNVNGNRARSNNFQIDGSDNNDLSVAGPALFVDNQDAVQELQVITNNFSAQYGRNQGAIINYVSKSGTNDFHGSAFEFHRNNTFLDSLDNIEKAGGQQAPNENLFNVFGGTVGGPLPIPHFGEGGKGWLSGKDRAFFFVSYQGVRNPATVTLRSGSFAFLPSQFPLLQAAFPGNAVINAITTQSVFALQPTAQPRPGTTTTVTLNGQNFLVAEPQYTISEPFTETDYTTRFDFKVSNKDNITFRLLHQRQLFVNTLAQTNGFSGDLPAGSTNYGGSWTRTISPSLVSEARIFYQRINVEFGGCSAVSAGCIPGPLLIGSTYTNITLPTLNGHSLQSIGPATNLPQGRVGKVYQFADNLTWLHGRHSFIFGAEYKHLNEVSPFLPNFNGAFSYSSATRLINNAPSGISLTVGNPTLAFTENDQYYFVQDDFKWKPNLTLNLGVRYEYTGQPINVLHDQTVARESNAATAFYDPSLPLSVRTVPFVPADKNNFAPRIGFAYTPHFWKSLFGEDATVIRGGYSIAYEPAFYNILLNVQNVAPFSAAIALNTANALASATTSPLPLPGGTATGDVIRSIAASSGVLPLGHLNPLFLSQTTVSSDFHSPYSEQWSLGVQHQFGKNHVGEVRYVGTRGVGLFQNANRNPFVQTLVQGMPNWFGYGINMPSFANLLPPGITPVSCSDNPATPFVNESTCNGRILPQAGITERRNSAFSIYHSMQARYNGRFLNNSLNLSVAYTWSKTLDNAQEIFAIDDASSFPQNPFCAVTCEKGRSNIDRPQALSLSFIYDIPFMKEQRGFVGRALGGWQVNGVYVLTSGEPYTPGQFFNSLLGANNAYITAGDRPFVGNPNADPRLVAIDQVSANLFFDDPANGFSVPVTNVNGFYSLNALNQGSVVPVSPNDVRFIVNLPNSARIFGTPFGNSGRNVLRGPALNQLNASLFKNIKINERLSLQLRGEAYNVLNHPNPGYGVNAAGYLPDFFVEDAGVPSSSFANNQDIELARRVIQVGIRVVF